ncbi:MAG: Asp-tRNA(Asn)/Glu-tRNA(Gln) amidotransferase subunit GatC [Patescibacteria group bacterium]
MVTLEEIEKLAALARIELSDGEKQAFQKDVGAILEYVSSIKEASVGARGAPALSPALPVNVMREDTNPHESGRYTETLLRAAPQREGNYIRVKKVL